MVVTGSSAADSSVANTLDAATLREIEHAQGSLEELGAQLERSMSDLHALQDRFESAVKKQAKMLKNIDATRPSTSTLTAQAKRPSASASASALPPRKPEANHVNGAQSADRIGVAEYHNLLDSLKARLKNMQRLMPSSGGMFVEIFLGSINVRFMRKSERMAFKQEYEKLKMKLAPVFVVFCVLCLFLEDYRWLHMILQLSLTCYYVALAVRENILRTNGSNIRAWWIIHHYFTMMQGVLLLMWPDGESYARFRRPLHAFGLYNAVLIIFQTRYQMARLYTLRSLGRVNEMDVASSDSTQIHWSETMMLLVPLIVLGQIMQGYQAIRLMRIYRDFPSDQQILLLSLLSTANFIGNSTTTAQVLFAKRASSHKKPLSISSSQSASNSVLTSSADQAVPDDQSHENGSIEPKKLL